MPRVAFICHFPLSIGPTASVGRQIVQTALDLLKLHSTIRVTRFNKALASTNLRSRVDVMSGVYH